MAFIRDKNGRIVGSISTRQSVAGAIAVADALGIYRRSGRTTFSRYQPPKSEATPERESAVQEAARRPSYSQQTWSNSAETACG